MCNVYTKYLNKRCLLSAKRFDVKEALAELKNEKTDYLDYSI